MEWKMGTDGKENRWIGGNADHSSGAPYITLLTQG